MLVRRAARGCLRPTRERFVDRLSLDQDLYIVREGGELSAIREAVCYGSFDSWQPIENVDFRKVKTDMPSISLKLYGGGDPSQRVPCIVVDHCGMLEHHKIQPPTSPLPSCSDTELTPNSLEVFSDFLE